MEAHEGFCGDYSNGIKLLSCLLTRQYTNESNEPDFKVIKARRPKGWSRNPKPKTKYNRDHNKGTSPSPKFEDLPTTSGVGTDSSPCVGADSQESTGSIFCLLVPFDVKNSFSMLLCWFNTNLYQSPRTSKSATSFFQNSIFWIILIQTIMESQSYPRDKSKELKVVRLANLGDGADPTHGVVPTRSYLMMWHPTSKENWSIARKIA